MDMQMCFRPLPSGITKLTVATGIVLACGLETRADYLSDRKAAMELVRAGQHEEALSAFLKMADNTASDVQKSDALEQAAMRAQSLKRYDQALELARRIPLAPAAKTVEMRFLSEARKWREILDAFKNEDLDSWPEYVVGEASQLRGNACYQLGDGQGAAADLTRAAEYLTDSNSKGLALNALGDTYAALLKDDLQAVVAYRRVYQTDNVYKRSAAAMSVAAILARQNKLAEALLELETIDLDKVKHPYWRGRMLTTYGSLLAQQGKRAAAIVKYREAVQLQDLPPAQKSAYETALKDLTKAAAK